MPNNTISASEIVRRYRTPDTARIFFEERRWMDGVECPTCDSKEITPRLKRRGYRCRDCRQDFTVKTGTIFEGSNITLDIWLLAMYQVISARKGVSSLQLSKELGVSQKTAWFMLHRIRRAYNKTTKPVGIVENAETYIGGLDKNKHFP